MSLTRPSCKYCAKPLRAHRTFRRSYTYRPLNKPRSMVCTAKNYQGGRCGGPIVQYKDEDWYRCDTCGSRPESKARVLGPRTPPESFGSHGDNLFCGLTCGYRWARAFWQPRLPKKGTAQ